MVIWLVGLGNGILLKICSNLLCIKKWQRQMIIFPCTVKQNWSSLDFAFSFFGISCDMLLGYWFAIGLKLGTKASMDIQKCVVHALFFFFFMGKWAINILKSQKRLHQVHSKYTCVHQRKKGCMHFERNC